MNERYSLNYFHLQILQIILFLLMMAKKALGLKLQRYQYCTIKLYDYQAFQKT